MKNRLTLLLALFITTVFFAQENWQTFEKDNYSINYPVNWEYSDEKPQPSIQFVLMSEEASQAKDMFRENINLTLENLNGEKLSLKAYAELSIDQIKLQIPSAKIISNNETKTNGKDAREIIWSADIGNSMILRFKQIFILNNDTAYILTFSATTTDYNKYITNASKILYSFKFTK